MDTDARYMQDTRGRPGHPRPFFTPVGHAGSVAEQWKKVELRRPRLSKAHSPFPPHLASSRRNTGRHTHRYTHRYPHRIYSPPFYIALYVRQHRYARILTDHLNNMVTSRRTYTDRCTHRHIHTLRPTTPYYFYARVDRHVSHRPREHNFPGDVVWWETPRARAPVIMHHDGQCRCA